MKAPFSKGAFGASDLGRGIFWGISEKSVGGQKESDHERNSPSKTRGQDLALDGVSEPTEPFVLPLGSTWDPSRILGEKKLSNLPDEPNSTTGVRFLLGPRSLEGGGFPNQVLRGKWEASFQIWDNETPKISTFAYGGKWLEELRLWKKLLSSPISISHEKLDLVGLTKNHERGREEGGPAFDP
jgi:hypothetical protein